MNNLAFVGALVSCDMNNLAAVEVYCHVCVLVFISCPVKNHVQLMMSSDLAGLYIYT